MSSGQPPKPAPTGVNIRLLLPAARIAYIAQVQVITPPSLVAAAAGNASSGVQGLRGHRSSIPTCWPSSFSEDGSLSATDMSDFVH